MMDQETRWLTKYNEVVGFIETDRKLEWNYRGTLKKFHFLVVFSKYFRTFAPKL